MRAEGNTGQFTFLNLEQQLKRENKNDTVPFLLLGLAFIEWYRWGSASNKGLSLGYYGDFNRVRNALCCVPGVKITRDRANTDVTLEEFGFNVETNAGQSISLDFQESDPTRNLSGAPLTCALIDMIQTKPSHPTIKNEPPLAAQRTSASHRLPDHFRVLPGFLFPLLGR